jgi:hypothetical protein
VNITHNGFERLETSVFIFSYDLDGLSQGLFVLANLKRGVFLAEGVAAHTALAPFQHLVDE